MTVFLIGIPSGYVVTRDTVEEMYARQTPYLRRIRFRGGTLITMWDMVSHWKHRIVIMPTLSPPTISVVIDNRESSWCQLSRHPWLQLSLKSDSRNDANVVDIFYFDCHWNSGIVMMPTLASIVTLKVVLRHSVVLPATTKLASNWFVVMPTLSSQVALGSLSCVNKDECNVVKIQRILLMGL